MFRITNRMMYNNTLINAFRNNSGLLNAQEQISSGKRVNKPSDDPIGIMEILQLRTEIGKADQYMGVMDNAESFLNAGDTTLGGVHDQLKTAKEKALEQAGGMSTSTTRATTAITIDNMVDQMMQFGNTRIGSRYLFAGQRSELPAIDANGRYSGSGADMTAEISENQTIPISVKASDFLAADMNPSLSAAANGTLLADLNKGSGVPVGNFNITDRAGTVVNIDTTAMTDLEDVIAAINAGGTNITASVSTDGTALVLTDSTATPIQALTVQDNTTSQALGIAGTRNTSTFTGTDLDPAINSNTLLSDLYGGTGITMDDIVVMNGGLSGTVSFTGDTTVGDAIASINATLASDGSAMNLTASLSSSGRNLEINSTVATTVAFAKEAGSGNAAELLGIGGGRNVIPVLQKFSAALKANDAEGILAAVELLDTNMDNTSSVRGAVGSRVNQVITNRSSVDNAKYDNTKLKSFVEDADYLEAASELAMLQTAYQATLKSSAAIIQPSLMDFVR